MAISCTIPLEQVPLQGLQSYRKISIEPTTLWMEEKRVPFIDEWLVRLSTYITQGEAALQESAATMPSDIEFIVQWIGALVTQCPGLMMDMQSELLCDYICPHIEEMYPLGFRTDAKDWTVETIQHQQWQGFIGCDMIKSICESLQREVLYTVVVCHRCFPLNETRFNRTLSSGQSFLVSHFKMHLLCIITKLLEQQHLQWSILVVG